MRNVKYGDDIITSICQVELQIFRADRVFQNPKLFLSFRKRLFVYDSENLGLKKMRSTPCVVTLCLL